MSKPGQSSGNIMEVLSGMQSIPGAAPLFESLTNTLKNAGGGLSEIFQDVMKNPSILLSRSDTPEYQKTLGIVQGVIMGGSKDLFSKLVNDQNMASVSSMVNTQGLVGKAGEISPPADTVREESPPELK